jgi:hypothetical protein
VLTGPLMQMLRCHAHVTLMCLGAWLYLVVLPPSIVANQLCHFATGVVQPTITGILRPTIITAQYKAATIMLSLHTCLAKLLCLIARCAHCVTH